MDSMRWGGPPDREAGQVFAAWNLIEVVGLDLDVAADDLLALDERARR